MGQSSHDSASRELREGQTREIQREVEGVTDSRGGQERSVALDSESRATVVWNAFDRRADTAFARRNRPHWDQNGAITFVTIRLLDSMPRAVVQRWIAELEDWLQSKGIDTSKRPVAGDGQSGFERIIPNAPEKIRRAFLKLISQRWHESLDACYGRCLLRHQPFAQIVAEAFLQFDCQRYDVERFVVMPNHCHLLVQMRVGWGLRKQCESWMRFTGRKINRINGVSGKFWAEPFDHIVRSNAQFLYLQKYILENPVKAKLAAGNYLLWVRDRGFLR